MFGGIMKKLMLRTKCSCGGNSHQFVVNFFKCKKCKTVWDGRDEYTQQKVLIKERNTVIREI